MIRPNGAALDQLLVDASVVICCGTGGVGKTTTAAVLGVQAARLGRRAVVVTIDPAKRLADAFGLAGGLTNDPVLVQLTDLDPDDDTATTTATATTTEPATTHASEPATGQLWAMMLDTATTFDGLVRANAATPEQAERILANGFYRNIAGSLSGTQEYMAAERLHSLHLDDRFDLVIVDTPPTRNALDFLDAPGTLSRFVDHPLFKLLITPTRRGLKVLNIAAQPVLRTIGKVIGGDVLADAIAFFQAFEGMETGFRQRADQVLDLLSSPVTRFVLIASPRGDTIAEARYFADRLRSSSLSVAALIVNRATPRFDGSTELGSPTAVPTDIINTEDSGLRDLYDNLDQLTAMADGEVISVQPLFADIPDCSIHWVPLLDGDVHDQAALQRIRRLLFNG